MASTLITVADITARDALSPAVGDTVYQIDNNKINVCSALGPVVWQLYDSDGTGGYALDGSSTLTAVPNFHFDAAKINGVDATGNPSNAASLTSAWASKINGVSTFAQGTGADQPTWYSSGTSSESYLSSGGGANGDTLVMNFRTALFGPIAGPFTMMGVMEQVGTADFTMGGGILGDVTSSYWGTAPWWNNAGTDYYYWQQTGADSGAKPTFASGVGNGSTAVASYTVTRLFMVIRDSSNNTRLFVDGNNTNTANVGTSSADLQMSHMWQGLNASYMSNGHTYEMALWDSDLSTADRNTIITYANSRYGTGRNADDSYDLPRATF
jgi:hypothetical protein